MSTIANLNIDYGKPVRIADDIYWVGFHDTESGLHCNPYLIMDGGEAIIIDSGSRPHFPVVMMKILQAGVDPSSIIALVYQHFDPDLCGNISHFEDLIGRSDLKIISSTDNNHFIRYYAVRSELYATESMDHTFSFSSGRRLRFIRTPYAHSAGSLVTLDEKTGVLFTSDLFGSYGSHWELFLNLKPECHTCQLVAPCPFKHAYCPLLDIMRFHRSIMPSERVLHYAIKTIINIPFQIIAPQHGSVIHQPRDLFTVSRILAELKGVGIDQPAMSKTFGEMGDINALKERLKIDAR